MQRYLFVDADNVLNNKRFELVKPFINNQKHDPITTALINKIAKACNEVILFSDRDIQNRDDLTRAGQEVGITFTSCVRLLPNTTRFYKILDWFQTNGINVVDDNTTIAVITTSKPFKGQRTSVSEIEKLAKIFVNTFFISANEGLTYSNYKSITKALQLPLN